MTEVQRVVRIDPARARAMTASVMTRAQHEVPSYHLTRQVPCGRIQGSARGAGISVTAAMMQPVARWLTEFQALNGHLHSGEFVPSATVDLGVAVAHRENVLIVVTLSDCGAWGPAEFGGALSDIRAKNQENGFVASDFARPSFTVSNLGGFGIDEFTSIITPPQVGVLSIGAVRRTPVITDGEVSAEFMVALTLGLDHRAVDGAYGARALARLAELFQAPAVSANERILS